MLCALLQNFSFFGLDCIFCILILPTGIVLLCFNIFIHLLRITFWFFFKAGPMSFRFPQDNFAKT